MTTTSYSLQKPLGVLRRYVGHDYTIAGLFASRLRAGADRPLIFSAGTWWTWGQVAERAARLARLLVARGVRSSDRVAVMGLNSDKHVLLLLALSRIGAILVPINPAFGKGETAYILGDCRPAVLACDVDVLDVVRAASHDSGVSPSLVSLAHAVDDVPSLELLLEQDHDAELPRTGAPDDTCLIVYTSGTTGFPKGVMHSQLTFLTVGEASVQRVYLQPEDRVLIVLPMFHINALFYSVAGTLTAGCAMIVTPKFSASRFWDFVVETGATEVNIIEAIGTILMNRPRSEFRPEHQLRAVYGIRQAAAPTFRNEFGIPDLITGYGMTEIPGALCSPFEGPQKPGSMGTVGAHPDPHRPWTEARVVDDEGHPVEADVTGELSVKTPVIMQGYYGKPEQTAQAFRDGWFMTGDLVRRDADGYYYFVSRKGDIIRRRGENISGAELDRTVAAHPKVQEVAAVPIASELGEDEILLAVLPKPDVSLEAEEITHWCAERLAPAKVPRYVLFVTELPHTATHKIAKQVLRSDPTLKERAIDTLTSKTRAMSSRSQPMTDIKTHIATADATSVTVRGKDLTELIGHQSFTEMLYFLTRNRFPTRVERIVLDACLVTLMEHGLNASTLITRLAGDSVPGQVQVAMAAGLMVVGDVFVGTMEGCARILRRGVEEGGDFEAYCQHIVSEYTSSKQPIPGFGHATHTPDDPRAVRLFEVATEIGLEGTYIDLLKRLGAELDRARGRHLTINATGAVAALLLEVGIPVDIMRGFAVVSRAGGLIGHLMEERESHSARLLCKLAREHIAYEDPDPS